MAFKVGDVVQLKSGGARMIVSKLFKTPEGSEMVASVCVARQRFQPRAPLHGIGVAERMR